jgi:adenine phosphoribosyltransferase
VTVPVEGPAGQPRDDDPLTRLLSSRLRDVEGFPKPGVVFKDISPLLADPEAFAAAVDALAGHHPGHVDLVAGMEARGFILAAPVAIAARAGFVPVRKKGKLPGPVHEVTYALEYGEGVLAVHRDGVPPGARVLVVDDVLATGGTAAATVDLVRRSGGEVVGVSFLVELVALGGRELLPGLDIHALLRL